MTGDDKAEERASFFEGMAAATDRVFAAHRQLVDHRREFPWLTGSLGDPFSPVWFVAENPSLTQVRRMVPSTGVPCAHDPTPDCPDRA